MISQRPQLPREMMRIAAPLSDAKMVASSQRPCPHIVPGPRHSPHIRCTNGTCSCTGLHPQVSHAGSTRFGS
jgi:hypothetical protein